MSRLDINHAIGLELDRMTVDDKRSVLEFARALNRPGGEGESGKRLLRYASVLDPESARVMAETIEAGCERIDPNEW